MTAAETNALLSIQKDLFDARTALAFERRCIDNALHILREATNVFAAPKTDNFVHQVASIVDQATAALNRRLEES